MICEVCRERRKDTGCDRLQDQEKKKKSMENNACLPKRKDGLQKSVLLHVYILARFRATHI
jgi:hypothetical protein